MKKNKGFTLIELAVALGISATVMGIQMQNTELETAQVKAASMGKDIYTYNSAVSRYITNFSATPDTVIGTYTGTSWLKSASCGGTGSIDYLNCLSLENDRTRNYLSVPTTTITKSSDGALNARTVWSAVEGEGGKSQSMVMGIAAITASGSYVSENDSPASYVGATVYCPDIAAYTADIVATCQSDRDRIISTSSTNASIEKWLRVDHANTMLGAIEFDDGTGNATPNTGPGLSLDDIDGQSLRQIVNVARIYNNGVSGDDSIIIGKQQGNSIYSDSFVTSNNLLEGGAIIDGDLAIMGDIYAKTNVYIGKKLEVNGDAYMGSDLEVEGDAEIKGDLEARKLYASNAIDSDGQIRGYSLASDNNITARGGARIDGTITGRGQLNIEKLARFDDAIEATGYIKSASSIMAGGNMYSSGTIISRKNIMADGYITAKGRLNAKEDIFMQRTDVEGASCSVNGLLSRDSDGGAMSCVNRRWASLTSGKGISDLCTYNTSSRSFSDSKCASRCSGSASGQWRFVSAWDTDEGDAAGRTSVASGSSQRNLGSWYVVMCAKM